MRLVLLYLVVLALTLAFRSVPNPVDKKVDDGAKVAHHKAHDTVSDVPHVRRHDPVSCLTAFLQAFDAPLTTVGA